MSTESAQRFYNLTREMRKHQITYFNTRSLTSLHNAKKYETMVDEIITAVQKKLKVIEEEKQSKLEL